MASVLLTLTMLLGPPLLAVEAAATLACERNNGGGLPEGAMVDSDVTVVCVNGVDVEVVVVTACCGGGATGPEDCGGEEFDEEEEVINCGPWCGEGFDRCLAFWCRRSESW